jgi:hypothetical protein
MSSLAPFADVQALINQGCSDMLSNAIATYKGGEPFGVEFDSGKAELYPGDDTVADLPEFTVSLNLGKAPGLAQGSKLTINGKVYTVAGGVQPDSSGWAQRVPLALLKG